MNWRRIWDKIVSEEKKFKFFIGKKFYRITKVLVLLDVLSLSLSFRVLVVHTKGTTPLVTPFAKRCCQTCQRKGPLKFHVFVFLKRKRKSVLWPMNFEPYTKYYFNLCTDTIMLACIIKDKSAQFSINVNYFHWYIKLDYLNIIAESWTVLN